MGYLGASCQFPCLLCELVGHIRRMFSVPGVFFYLRYDGLFYII